MAGTEHAACISGAFVAAPSGGETTTLGDVETFVARGTRGGSALVLCTDIFGFALPNVRVLALQLAEKTGHSVYVPDIIGGGDACAPEGFDWSTLGAWFARHGDAETLPRLRRAVAALRASGISRIMTLGFCWGARCAVLAATGPTACVDAWGVAHPTKTAPSDYAAASGRPGLFLLAETDTSFPSEMVSATRSVLEGKVGPFSFEGPWAGTSHGFVVRGDDAVPEIAAARTAAREAAAAFFLARVAAWGVEDEHAACGGDHGHSHGEEDHGHSHAAHGHSHGGEACHGHGEPEEDHGHSHSGGHGHSHGGQECGGHGHSHGSGGGSGCVVA